MDGQAGQTPKEERGRGHGSEGRQKPVDRRGRKSVGVPGTRRSGAAKRLESWRTCPGTGRDRQTDSKQTKRERILRVSKGGKNVCFLHCPSSPELGVLPSQHSQSGRERVALSPGRAPPPSPSRALTTGTSPPEVFPAQVPASSPATWSPGWVLEAALASA